MSLEDLWKDETFVVDVMGIVVVCILIAVVLAIIVKIKQSIHYSRISITELKNVTVLSKNQTPLPLNPSVMTYSIMFKTEDGSRLSLKVRDIDRYQTLIEGDKGTLQYKDDLLITFFREYDG